MESHWELVSESGNRIMFCFSRAFLQVYLKSTRQEEGDWPLWDRANGVWTEWSPLEEEKGRDWKDMLRGEMAMNEDSEGTNRILGFWEENETHLGKSISQVCKSDQKMNTKPP